MPAATAPSAPQSCSGSLRSWATRSGEGSPHVHIKVLEVLEGCGCSTPAVHPVALDRGRPARARHHAGGHAAGHCSPPCFFSRACLTALSSWCSYDKLVKIMEQYDKDQSGGCWVGWRRGWLAGRRAELVGGDAACGGAWPDRTARAACTAGSIDFAEFLRMFRDELLDLQVAGGWVRVWCGVGWVCRWGGWGIEMLCGGRERERERGRRS